MSSRLSSFKTACILGLVLSGLSGLTFCIGAASLVMQLTGSEMLTNLQQAPPGATPEVQQDFQELANLSARYLPVSIAIQTWHLISLVLLIAACIAGLKFTRNSLVWFRRAMINCIAFEVVRAVPTFLIQYQTISIMSQLNAAGRPGGPPADTVMRVMMVIGIAVPALLLILRLAYYIWGLLLTLDEEVRNWFESADLPAEELESGARA